MKYLNEEKLDRLISIVQKSMAYDGILPILDDTLALHEALMILQFLVKRGFIKFEGDGFVFDQRLSLKDVTLRGEATGST